MPERSVPIAFEHGQSPQLLVFIDAEEEFRWRSYWPQSISVRNIAQQFLAQKIFDRYDVKPTYLVDYPVASQPDGFIPLKEFLADGRCSIGAQLHPWVNPPFGEELVVRNTFPGNLEPSLERAKLESLTAAIKDNFGITPRAYKAGRYGSGPNTAEMLIAAGYAIDTSVMPFTSFSREGGPDYISAMPRPYWVDAQQQLLELPTTVGLLGLLNGLGSTGVRFMLNEPSVALKVPAILSRLGLFERVRLTPEGIALEEACRLTDALYRRGCRLFVFSYHSSSLLPGSTPYVTTRPELDRFLGWIEGYLSYFLGAFGGRATTIDDVLALARTQIRV